MKCLKESDAKQCSNSWAWKDVHSESFFRSMIGINGGFALCDKETDEILSFGMVNDHLAVGCLNTVEKARGKGYGELITKKICKNIVENLDLHPTCYISTENTASIKLFKRIGFREIGGSNWIFVGPMTN